MKAPIRLASPELGAEEERAIARVLGGGLLVQGREVEAFERVLADRCGRSHAIAVSSGTAALELALHAIGVAGGEVIVPDLTWPSPAHAARLCGAEVVLVDVDGREWNARGEAFAAARSPRTRAAIAIDQFGVPARHAEIAAALPGVALVEDAACAIGSTIAGRPCGSFGLVACMSFHPRKVITTGEGGACLTDDAALAAEIRARRNHGQVAPGVFAHPGPNLRLTEMQAAMGLAQLARLPAIVARRRELADRYRARLPAIGITTVQELPEGSTRNEQTFGVVLDDPFDRDRVIARMKEDGVESGRLSYALHALDSLRGARSGAMPETDRIVARGLALPLHTGMRDDDVDRVLEALARALDRG